MENLLKDYRAAAIEHGEYTCSGQSDLANKAYGKLHGVLLTLIAESRDSEIIKLLRTPTLGCSFGRQLICWR